MGTLTLGSLFDGIGGWLNAAVAAGVTPIWASEIEPFPMAVTAARHPTVKQLGDITNLDGATVEAVDIVCAGSPCQDLSVAGKRAGLEGERSGLFHTAIKFIRDMRRATGGRYPRYFVWENVPGAFSSNKGMDFRAVLEEVCEAEIPMPHAGKWAEAGMVIGGGRSVAWRVLDAQYWGVPQRRRRIFLVADFASDRAGEILFERKSVQGNSDACAEKGEGTAGAAADCAGSAGGREVEPYTMGHDERSARFIPGVADPLTQSDYKQPPITYDVRISSNGTRNWRAHAYETNISRALDCAPQDTNGNHGGVAVVYPINTMVVTRGSAEKRTCLGSGGAGAPEFTISAAHCHGVAYCIAGNVIGRKDENGGHHLGVDEEVSFTLNTIDRHAVACGQNGGPQTFMMQAFGEYAPSEKASTLKQRDYKDATDLICAGKTVRRLTPTECERLQGLPDGYTLIDSKMSRDSARYKALGNGMAQPCADYVIKRIVELVDGNEV